MSRLDAVPGTRLLAAARVLFGEDAVARWLEPLVADFQAEWQAAGAGARRGVAWQGLLALPGPLAMTALRAGPGGVVAPLLPLLLLAALGVRLLGTEASPWAARQALWLLLALLAASVLGAAQWRGGRAGLLALIAGALAAAPLATGSAWVRLPALGLPVAPLELGLLPLLAALAVLGGEARRGAALALGASYALVAVRCDDAPLAAVVAAVTVAVFLRPSAPRWLHALPPLLAVGVLGALAGRAAVDEAPAHTDGVLHSLLERGGAAAMLLAAVLYAVAVVRLAQAAARRDGTAASGLAVASAHLLLARAAVHLLSIPLGLEVGALPPLGYGGSAVVATFALIGLAGGPPARPLVAR